MRSSRRTNTAPSPVDSRAPGAGLWRMSRPVGRVLSPRASRRHGGRPSISDCRCRPPRAVYPRTRAGSPRSPAQAPERPLDLAPGGVCQAAPVTRGAGGLLHRRFTLAAAPRAARRRSVFCGTFPRVTPGGRCPPPCPVEPGPSSRVSSARSPGRLVRPPSVGQRRIGCRRADPAAALRRQDRSGPRGRAAPGVAELRGAPGAARGDAGRPRLLVTTDAGGRRGRARARPDPGRRGGPERPAEHRADGAGGPGLQRGALRGPRPGLPGPPARGRAARWLAVTSSVFGLVRPGDPIPAYRLAGDVTLPGSARSPAHWRTAPRPGGAAARRRGSGGRPALLDVRRVLAAVARLARRVATVRVLHEVDGTPAGGQPLQQGDQGPAGARAAGGRSAPRARRRASPTTSARSAGRSRWVRLDREGTALDVVVTEV